MAALEDAVYDFTIDIDKLVAILKSNHNIPQSELDSALTIAICEGPDDVITLLLSHGARITDGSFCGAAGRRDVKAFEAFLDHGWDINSLEFGEPALR